jgi:hypothetical protein
MDSLLDAIAATIARAAESWLGVVAITSPIWLLAAVRIRRVLMRRRAYRAFAAAHQQLEFVGVIPSDARAPYTRIPLVSSAVLLSHVVEGEWDGLPIRLFEMPYRRGGPYWTTILVTVEGRLLRGPEAERVMSSRPDLLIRINLDVLCLSPQRRLVAPEFADWLSFTTALAKAMERDAKEAARFETPPETPFKREMFGTFSDD